MNEIFFERVTVVEEYRVTPRLVADKVASVSSPISEEILYLDVYVAT